MPAIDQSAETTGRGLPWREVKVVETAPETPRATISFEFAHVAARADAKVIVLDRGERPLKAFDPELVAKLLERTRTLGVTFHPNAAVEAIERTTAGFRVQASVAGRAETFEAETRIHTETAVLELRVAEVADPRPGDQLTVESETFVVQGEPERRDPDRLVRTLDMRSV
jgi:hypothetical protein